MKSVTSEIIGEKRVELGLELQGATHTISCIATSQSPDDINDQVVEDLENVGIFVLDIKDFVGIYQASVEQDSLIRVCEIHGFWLRQRK